ncbi:hypothetical protein RJ641_008723 [Dillenia turbinata]|uniref:Uncharacterized protein n=1 Tax=Dillenia turbinata TaxID=194707 RepID=A0AAN8V8N7_9MAGN
MTVRADGEAKIEPAENSRLYASSSPSALKGHDLEEYHIQQNRRSVIAKVRDKAKRWKQNLANKKNNSGGDNPTPSWGVSLEDDEDEEDDKDPEYLGAPMYESELAPEGLKESARQHPRANPVISKNHTLPSIVKTRGEQPKEGSPGAGKTETITEIVAPAYISVSEAANIVTSKPQGITMTSSSSPRPKEDAACGEQAALDRGVSVKEYLMHKFEPGEGEKALSQVITEAISPRKAPADVGYMEKVRGAVTSFLRPEAVSPSINNPKATKSYHHPTTSTTTTNFYEGN